MPIAKTTSYISLFPHRSHGHSGPVTAQDAAMDRGAAATPQLSMTQTLLVFNVIQRDAVVEDNTSRSGFSRFSTSCVTALWL
eukprot:5865368-Amphidinium_carterae.1